MLETISALRTNNARKIPNYDPSLLEHMKKLLKALLRTSGEEVGMELTGEGGMGARMGAREDPRQSGSWIVNWLSWILLT